MGADDDRYGGFVVGGLVASWLSGVVWAQGYRYFTLFPRGSDRAMFFYSVIVLLALDLATTVLDCISAYHYGLLDFNIPNPYIHYSFASHPVLVGLVTAIVQSLYAYRVWIVGRKRLVLPIIILGLALIQFGFATGATVIAFTRPVADFLSDYTFGITIWLASACVADFLITTSIVYHLRKAKKESGFVETQSILSTIIKTTIECNLLTAVVAMLDAIVFARVPNNWHVALNVVLTKLYTLSLLASLTARAKLGASTAGPQQGTFRSSQWGDGAHSGTAWRDVEATQTGSRIGQVKQGSIIMVTMDREIVHERDEDDSALNAKRSRKERFLAVSGADASLETSSRGSVMSKDEIEGSLA